MIYDKAHELARALKFSPEHKQYQEAKEKIGKNPENMKILKDFHLKQLEIQTMQMMGQEIPGRKCRSMKRWENFSLTTQRCGISCRLNIG